MEGDMDINRALDTAEFYDLSQKDNNNQHTKPHENGDGIDETDPYALSLTPLVEKTQEELMVITNPKRPNSTSTTDAVSRQVSIDEKKERPARLSFSQRRGQKRVFTVLNYGSKDISDCPPTPLSPTIKFEKQFMPNLSRQISKQSDHTDAPVWEHRIDMPQTPEIPRKVSFLVEDDKLESDSQKTVTYGGTFSKQKLQFVDVLRRGRLFAKRKQKRLVFKSGEVNFSNTNVQKKSLSYFLDIFTTLLDMKWRYIGIIFIMAFFATWMFFAMVWWAFVLVAEHRDSNNGTDITPCLDGVDDFATALLFSIETQHTIGYGTRSVTPNCPLAILFIMLQSLIGVLLSCVMTGLIFAKFARPKGRAETILFSKNAVICERDGVRCLMFRVGDMRRTHMACVDIRAMLIRSHVTLEHEEIPFYQHHLNVQTESEDFFFLAWPIKVIHKIDSSSPLYTMSSEDLIASDFEIVVVLEGTNQTTGQSTQIRTSYLPGEILWGHRLNSLITSIRQNNKYQVDYTRFHDTIPVMMGESSAETCDREKESRKMLERKLGIGDATSVCVNGA